MRIFCVSIVEREERTYAVGRWVISFKYEKSEEGRALRCVKIRPLSPFEAEILKASLGLPFEWSYDDESRSVELWLPSGARISRNLEDEILSALVRVVPELGRELSAERLREALAEKGWVVSVSGTRVLARRPIELAGEYVGYIEVDLAKRGEFFAGSARVTVFAESVEEARAKAAELMAMLDAELESEYPILRLKVDIKEGLAPEVEERVEDVYRKVFEAVA